MSQCILGLLIGIVVINYFIRFRLDVVPYRFEHGFRKYTLIQVAENTLRRSISVRVLRDIPTSWYRVMLDLYKHQA